VGVDTLAVGAPWISPGAPSRGTRASAFVGAAAGASGDRTRYVRYGLDAIQYFDLYRGDRVLLVRVHGEGVAARSDEDIPFTDLPRLGGPQFLRGYARDRFRDRVAVLGSIEYRYPIWRELSGFLFVDAGRVAPGIDALSGHFRPGAGGGLELYSNEAFRMRTQLAGSSDGLFFHLAVEAVYRQSTPPYRI
jgi:outer membrane translocation and assembly module TamA